ncbi:plasmid pRiA4b ORF-3 family protein [Azospirillum sp. RWY-5-1]|uniref:Plasmid pRiA4b ORF-3 family protein n=2 Tax=Azospirillum oleiclasticum TaxID=2735135 RepID=A0ABX2TJG1_9PROT|nr:plasmid pRiA4b ORF-3 family protein [Azospirillum oleiclasticum]NYZ14345.1 plasmid pRiA4b ORF-3 family protein [Azospirillum oleiclasticum]NYZ23303.1 plasmid pRiA4b ORF-3 family protein [Azospirillum oleiclasticum]
MPRWPSAKSTPPEPPSGSILQVKVRLLEVRPMVWRRILVPASYTLEELHGVLQVAMGWEGIHLYRFRIRAVHYGSFDLCVSSPRVPLNAFRFRKGTKITYDYDMAAFWRHEVRIEDRLDPEPGRSYPVCIAGDNTCPPEDCGGPEGYADRRHNAVGFDAMDDVATLAGLIEAIVVEKNIGLLDDPDTRWNLEEVADRIRASEPFLPNAFSRRAVNRRF